MPDVFTKAKRSEVMSLIRSRGNKDTELRMIEVFRQQGITGWRRHVALSFQVRDPDSPRSILKKKVRPDFVFRLAKVVVFVDGCFWHGCPEHYRRPGSRQEFWDAKIARNQARDAEVDRALRRAGWRVLRLWEHALARRHEKRLLARLRRAGLGII
jgi:DNA mismatch endonuclease (patch repair protein)